MVNKKSDAEIESQRQADIAANRPSDHRPADIGDQRQGNQRYGNQNENNQHQNNQHAGNQNAADQRPGDQRYGNQYPGNTGDIHDFPRLLSWMQKVADRLRVLNQPIDGVVTSNPIEGSKMREWMRQVDDRLKLLRQPTTNPNMVDPVSGPSESLPSFAGLRTWATEVEARLGALGHPLAPLDTTPIG